MLIISVALFPCFCRKGAIMRRMAGNKACLSKSSVLYNVAFQWYNFHNRTLYFGVTSIGGDILKKTMKLITLVVAFIMALCFMSGCGQTSEEEPTGSSNGITIFNSKMEIQDQMLEMAKRYTEETGVPVEVYYSSDTVSAHLATRYASGNPYTLSMVDAKDIYSLAEDHAVDMSGIPGLYRGERHHLQQGCHREDHRQRVQTGRLQDMQSLQGADQATQGWRHGVSDGSHEGRLVSGCALPGAGI